MQPTLIACKTKIGYGSPNKESKSSSHGSPLGDEEVKLTRKNLKWNNQPFDIPDNLLSEWRSVADRNNEIIVKWHEKNKSSLNSSEFKKIYSKDFDSKISDAILDFKKMHIKEKTNCGNVSPTTNFIVSEYAIINYTYNAE